MKLKNISCILLSAMLFSCGNLDDNPELSTKSAAATFSSADNVHLWVTSRDQSFRFTEVPIEYSNDASSLTVQIGGDIYQRIIGYGGTLTGSSAYLLRQMSPSKRTETLRSLFDPVNGIGLENIRISIGASDFSLEMYTYCDRQGIENFAIPELDKRDLIPVLKEILAINPNVKIIASAWSPPAWMKSSNNLNYGSLKGPEVYDDYATYFVKFIQAMRYEGIDIYAITLQNEADFESWTHPSMKMAWQEQATIIKSYLGPKFLRNGITSKILVLDHNFDLAYYAQNVMGDPAASAYINGTAFHGYAGSPSDIRAITAAFPEKRIYQTELSGGGWNNDTEMGTMFYYLNTFLVPCMQYGSSNFMMFNIALNSQHGPVTPGGTFCEDCRGIVTIDGDNVKQELEYPLLAHFSKVSRTGAQRIQTEFRDGDSHDVSATAFLNPDGSKGIIVVNNSGRTHNITFKLKDSSQQFVYKIDDSKVYSFLIK